MNSKLGVYYFPGYHADPITNRLHGEGWTEWDLVAAARPRYPGHRQPKIPTWGYFDESEPNWALREARLAAQHKIDFFIYDWYWYNNGQFLNGALDDGYLGAEAEMPVSFALMWANHDWRDIHPTGSASPPQVLFRGGVSDYEFDAMADHLVERYFCNSNYFKLDDAPYFSIYEPQTLIDGLGSLGAAAAAIERLRDRASRAGIADIHLNVILADRAVLPDERQAHYGAATLSALGVASTTSYVWVHHFDPSASGYPVGSYVEAARANARVWDAARDRQTIPYFPNVTVGWDASPRALQTDRFEDHGYPWGATLEEGSSPEAFREALGSALLFNEKGGSRTGLVTLNAWNEWTEGSYLLPDAANGLSYLEACRDAADVHATGAHVRVS